MSRPWEEVTDADYFRDVMGNMVTAGLGPRDSLLVRFGNQGIGHAPNYQVEATDGRVVAFHGIGHGRFEGVPTGAFDGGHLSKEQFSYEDIKAMLAKRR